MLKNIELEKAQDLLLSRVTSLPKEKLSLLQATGRVVAEEIDAPHDLPAYPQSAMDGYAVNTALEKEHFRYEVLEDLLPGQAPTVSLDPGQATGVVTGGPLPTGANGVIVQENTERQGKYMVCRDEIGLSNNIKTQGEDFRSGDVLARPGTILNPGLVSVLAAYGREEIQVFRRPLLAVLGLGPDIVACEQSPRPGQVRDSNGFLLAALAGRDEVQVSAMELAGTEDLLCTRDRLKSLLEQSDVVVTTGGTAFGVADQAEALLQQSGAEVLCWGVRIKPGGHCCLAFHGDKPIVCLSGNPSACAVGYYLFIAPLLRVLQGLNSEQVRLQAVCVDGVPKRGGPRRFIQALASIGEAGWEVKILPGQKSSMMRALTGDCNALIDLPAGHQPIPAGAKVPIMLLQAAYRYRVDING